MDLAKIMCQSIRPNSPAAVVRAKALVELWINKHKVVIFSKSFCPACDQAKDVLASAVAAAAAATAAAAAAATSAAATAGTAAANTPDGELPAAALELSVLEMDIDLSKEDCAATQDCLWNMTGMRTVPRIFIHGRSIGGKDDLERIAADGDLLLSMLLTTGGANTNDDDSKDDDKVGPGGAPPVIRATVTYGDQCCSVDAVPSMTGLQLKSLILATLQLDMGFGDCFLTCHGRTFPSRGAVSTVVEFVDGAALDLVRRGEGEAKHVGET